MSDTQLIESTGGFNTSLDAPAGAFVFVNFTTQADFTYTVVITDSAGSEYFKETRQSRLIEPPVLKSFQIDHADLNIQVTVEAPVPSVTLRVRYSDLIVTGPDGTEIARTDTFVGEDYNDEDWNDLLLSITWWKHAG
jgi:hypothetical protein